MFAIEQFSTFYVLDFDIFNGLSFSEALSAVQWKQQPETLAFGPFYNPFPPWGPLGCMTRIVPQYPNAYVFSKSVIRGSDHVT